MTVGIRPCGRFETDLESGPRRRRRSAREQLIEGSALCVIKRAIEVLQIGPNAPERRGGDVWIGIDHLRFGIIGMPVSLIAMVAVTLMTPEPDAETQAMVDEMRVPKGETVLSQQH